jgi:hypothetical protein
VLDGFQLGRQNEAHSAEGGVYGGLIPTALGLAPTMDIWAAGLYGAVTETGNNRSPFRLARQEARVGVWRGPLAGLVGEAEALGQVWLGPARLGGGGRLRLAPSVAAQPVVERAYVDLGLQPVPSLGAAVHVRYFGTSLLDEEAALRALTPNLSGGLSALADAHWEAQSWVGVGGYADAHRDAQTGMARFHGAAEIRFPRALGEVGGVWLGAEAEEGWMRGRGYYVQLVGRFADRVQALARASANTSEFTTPDARPNVRELGAYLHLDGALASWVRLRAWSLLRVPFLVQDAPPGDAAPGVVFGSSLTGVF